MTEECLPFTFAGYNTWEVLSAANRPARLHTALA